MGNQRGGKSEGEGNRKGWEETSEALGSVFITQC
jgi:hypothetical protein